MIFTLPPALNPWWLANVPGLTALLFHAVRDTLVAFLADPQSLDAPPGMIAARHTWRPRLVRQPHVHGLVTGGGLPPAGPWQAVRTGLRLPGRVSMALGRGTRLAASRQALARGDLGGPAGMRPQPRLNLRTRVGHPPKTQWNGHRGARDRHGAGVETSLARALRGGPIKNARLGAGDGDRVPCPCRPRPEEADGASAAAQRMTRAVADGLPRWLLPVPVPQRRGVRSDGLYHPTQAEALAVCRAALGQPPVAAPAALAWQTVCAQRGALQPACCPTCGQLLVCTGGIPRGGAPPPLRTGVQAACVVVCRGAPAKGVVGLRAALARRPLAHGSIPRVPSGPRSPAWTGLGGASVRCQAGGRRVHAVESA